jgi:Sulfotransferase family
MATPPGPIFIGGAGRSGTTLVRVMLDAHPHICCGPELKVLPAIAEWYQLLLQSYGPVMKSYHNAPADLRLYFRTLIENLMGNFRRASGKPRWAEKTPHNILFMLPLGDIFPDARFLHVIRDGRDVACSLVRMDWVNPLTGRKWDYVENIRNAARYWREVITTARTHATHRSLAGRVLEVRYEALVADPERTIRQVLEFLDEPWDPAVLSYHTKSRDQEPAESSTAQAMKPLNPESLGRWQREMTDADKVAFKKEAGRLLRELGYAKGDW